jgi:SAM-dependent methyltransferase
VPWFGGSAGVWAVCLTFFQLVLLAGYGYADLVQRLSTRLQVRLHGLLLLVSLLWLPILATEGLKPTGSEDPSLHIIFLLAVTIGLPYFMLSTTGPLVQSWFARAQPSPEAAQKAYRLFALSNLGSLLALVSYPFGIERVLAVPEQAWIWSIGFFLFVVTMLALAWHIARQSPVTLVEDGDNTNGNGPTIATPLLASPSPLTEHAAPAVSTLIFWFALSALASALLLSASSHISQNIASVPFLWVLPLSLYLLSFVVAFEGRAGKGFYLRDSMMLPSMAAAGIMAWGLTAQDGILDIDIAVPLYSFGLFLICLFCHGELAQSKPPTRYLTRFYLLIALGGAAGGGFVSLLAPRLFSGYWEMPLSLLLIGLLGIWVGLRQRAPVLRGVLALGGFAAAVAVGHFSVLYWDDYQDRSIYAGRNFYGPLRVQEVARSDDMPYRRLVHGVILHGLQYRDPEMQRLATTYYSPNSGVGRALHVLHSRKTVHVGVVGLGVGTLVGYARPEDRYRIYEINPLVIEVARDYFSYLDQAKQQTTMVLGDARLRLEQERDQGFDLLAIDAFSSDAIPVHLLTREAMAVYVRHLAPNGVLAIHITNRYLALAPVVKQLADELGYGSALIAHEPSDTEPWSTARSEWVLVTRDIAFLNTPEIADHRVAILARPELRVWTDDFHNLFEVLK